MLGIVSLLGLLLSFSAGAMDSFPHHPDEALTPGALCDHPDRYRYAERIGYCERDVSTFLKQHIFEEYDRRGYRTLSMNRGSFKIDHYIPLCMGGSNDPKNLWPQHESVYSLTDSLEGLLCEKMAQGRLKQKEAVSLIVRAKNNLEEVRGITSYVRKL
ncbi:MAG: hypothetical protein AAGB31_00290 [Bdellovibrio sp.]